MNFIRTNSIRSDVQYEEKMSADIAPVNPPAAINNSENIIMDRSFPG